MLEWSISFKCNLNMLFGICKASYSRTGQIPVSGLDLNRVEAGRRAQSRLFPWCPSLPSFPHMLWLGWGVSRGWGLNLATVCGNKLQGVCPGPDLPRCRDPAWQDVLRSWCSFVVHENMTPVAWDLFPQTQLVNPLRSPTHPHQTPLALYLLPFWPPECDRPLYRVTCLLLTSCLYLSLPATVSLAFLSLSFKNDFYECLLFPWFDLKYQLREWKQIILVNISPPLFSSCVISGKLHNFSEPLLPHPLNRDNDSICAVRLLRGLRSLTPHRELGSLLGRVSAECVLLVTHHCYYCYPY